MLNIRAYFVYTQNMKKLSLILFLTLLLISCSINQQNNSLQIALSQEPPTLDVNKNSSISSRLILVGNVFEKLLTLNSRGTAVPELCESYTRSEDARSYKFKLREGVFFHDKTELTSKEAVDSLNRWVENYKVAKTAFGESRFVVLDKYNFKVELEYSLLLLPEMLASSPFSAVIMASSTLASLDNKGFITSYIGTGPYMFESWALAQEVTLVKNPNYKSYGGTMDGLAGKKETNFDKLVYHFVPDAVTRTLGLETGEYDFINDVMNDDIPRLTQKKQLNIFRGSEGGSFVVVFNKKEGICSNQYMREAINLSVDFDQALAACYGDGGYTLRANYMDNEQAFWQVEGLDSYYNQKNIERAKQLLKDNNYEGQVVRILTPNLSNMDKTAVALKSELAKLGISSELIISDWATVMSKRKDSSSYDIYLTALSSVPIPSLKLFLDPTYPGWSEDETLQFLILDFNQALSYEEAKNKWEEIQHYCYEYLPVMVLGHYLSGYGWQTKLQNVNTYMGFYFWNATLNT